MLPVCKKGRKTQSSCSNYRQNYSFYGYNFENIKAQPGAFRAVSDILIRVTIIILIYKAVCQLLLVTKCTASTIMTACSEPGPPSYNALDGILDGDFFGFFFFGEANGPPFRFPLD